MKNLLLYLYITATWSIANKSDKYKAFKYTNVPLELPYDYVSDESSEHKVFLPVWRDLDTRIAPMWYDESKIGIFIHWGVYSVIGYPQSSDLGSEWFWYRWKEGGDIASYMSDNFEKNFTYKQFTNMFTADEFNATEWAELFFNSGAKYVVLTTKHHDGFALFPSDGSDGWNSVFDGPYIDIVKEVSNAVRKYGLKFGAYYSLFEWYHPMYLRDKEIKFKTKDYVESVVFPDLKQLVNDYKPSVLWADGEWEAPSWYWKSASFLAWLYNESPVREEVVVNDRWGSDTRCVHGDFFNCDDRYNPGKLQKHKWENAFTIDKDSWGYRVNLKPDDFMSVRQIIKTVVSTVSCGGNVLINIGPTKDGTIVAGFKDRLLYLGAWLKVNGEAIYKTSPWFHQNDSMNTNVWYTCRREIYDEKDPIALPNESDRFKAVYAIFLKWPKDNVVKVKDLAKYLLENDKMDLLDPQGFIHLKWVIVEGMVEITVPYSTEVNGRTAWTIAIKREIKT